MSLNRVGTQKKQVERDKIYESRLGMSCFMYEILEMFGKKKEEKLNMHT